MSNRTAAARLAIAAAATAGCLAVCSREAQARVIRCGDVITTDTTLRSDLSNCRGDGLVIAADDITLDLNGHTIDGVQAGPRDCDLQATGIHNPAGHDGVTIQNGTVQQFGAGIDGGFGRSRLRNLTVRDNRGAGIGIGAFGGDNLDANEITRNQFLRNGCSAINLTGAHHVRIAGNRIAGRRDRPDRRQLRRDRAQLRVRAAMGSSPSTATSIGSSTTPSPPAGTGSCLFSSDDNRVSENSTSGNFFGGIAIKASSRNRVSGNSSTAEPAGVGLEAELEEEPPVGSDANVVSGNRSVRDGIGVLVLASDANQIVGNRVVEALEHPPGFPLHGGFGIVGRRRERKRDGGQFDQRAENVGIHVVATTAWGGVAAGNVLRGNLVRGAGGDGMLIDASASGQPARGQRGGAGRRRRLRCREPGRGPGSDHPDPQPRVRATGASGSARVRA